MSSIVATNAARQIVEWAGDEPVALGFYSDDESYLSRLLEELMETQEVADVLATILGTIRMWGLSLPTDLAERAATLAQKFGYPDRVYARGGPLTGVDLPLIFFAVDTDKIPPAVRQRLAAVIATAVED